MVLLPQHGAALPAVGNAQRQNERTTQMAYMISHFYEGGTSNQYDATVAAVHPAGGLPDGQVYHAAGPTDGGYLIVAVWDSKEACDSFISDKLMAVLPTLEGGLAGPPQERSADVHNLETA
jgi:hypothetical protein